MSQAIGNANWNASSYSGFAEPAAAAPVPSSYAEWRRFADDNLDRAAEFAGKFFEGLAGEDLLTFIDCLHGVRGADSEELRARFERFVTRRW